MAGFHQDIAAVRAFAERTSLRPATLAQKAGLSINALRGFELPNWAPSLKTLGKLLAFIEREKRAEPKEGRAA